MNKIKQLKNYISKLKVNNGLDVSDYFLEKDYVLSLFLSNWSKINSPNLDKLIFKGGTLLTKNYLKYHRISEDLDFTHKDSNYIRSIKSKNKKENEIKKRIVLILREIEEICKLSNLDFKNDRKDNRYI